MRPLLRQVAATACISEEVLAEAALAACHAQSDVARLRLGQNPPRCTVPCQGCLAAARAVLEVVSVRMPAGPELHRSLTVTSKAE